MNLVIFNRSENLAREELEEAEGKIGRKSISDISSINDTSLPLILSALLSSLEKSYKNSNRWPLPPGGENITSTLLFASSEKRKAWIYDVPLVSSHKLRNSIIDLLESKSKDGISNNNIKEELEALLNKFDPPVLAATVKLWCLELEQSLIHEGLWDQVDNLYKAAGSQEREGFKQLLEKNAKDKKDTLEGDETVTESKESKDDKDSKAIDTPVDSKGKGKGNADQQKDLKLDDELVKKIKADTLQDLKVVLGKLPKIHLVCLDALINHLAK